MAGPLDDLAALTRHAELAAEAKPLGPKADPLAVPVKDLLPPAAALTPEALAGLDRATAEAAKTPADEPVTLDFFGDDLPVREFVLRFPFHWSGERVEAVEVHQLTVAEVGQAFADLVAKDGSYDRFALYGRMVRVKGTGTPLPAAVLRKLPSVDGEPITDAAFGFLPPSFRVTAG